MLERLSPFFFRAVVRAVVIAVVTLFVASALFTPQLNPVTRGSFLASVNVGPVWGELVQWRVAMIEARNELDGWPKDIHQYAPRIANPQLRVTSPRPNVLQADIAHNPELGKLAGTQVVVELKPGTHTWTCRSGGSSKVLLTTSTFGPFTVRLMSVTSSGRSSMSSTMT